MYRKKLLIIYFFAICIMVMSEGIYLKDTKSWDKIFEDSQTVDYPVIFIHGIGGGLHFWEDTANLVSNGNYYDMRYYLDGKIYHNYINGTPDRWIFNISYYTLHPIKETIDGDLTEYAKRLEKIINNIKIITKKDKVVLIAHSMGGLVARKYAVMNDENWESIYKLVTVGTPNTGVKTSVGIVGQLKDLKAGSDFLTELDEKWNEKSKKAGTKWPKWGVVGGIESRLWLDLDSVDGSATDLAGVGYIELESAIPLEEWKLAFKDLGEEKELTNNFGFRILVKDNHLGLLENIGTLKAIKWAVRK